MPKKRNSEPLWGLFWFYLIVHTPRYIEKIPARWADGPRIVYPRTDFDRFSPENHGKTPIKWWYLTATCSTVFFCISECILIARDSKVKCKGEGSTRYASTAKIKTLRACILGGWPLGGLSRIFPWVLGVFVLIEHWSHAGSLFLPLLWPFVFAATSAGILARYHGDGKIKTSDFTEWLFTLKIPFRKIRKTMSLPYGRDIRRKHPSVYKIVRVCV